VPVAPPFVVFSDDWGRWPSSSQHLFRHIGRDHPTLWVETLGMRLPRLGLDDLSRTVGKVRSWTGAAPVRSWSAPPPALTRIAPPMHPWYGSRLGAAINDRLLVRAVRRCGVEAPVLFISVPVVGGVVGRLGERLSVYYRVDDFTLWPGYAARTVARRERALLDRVDAVVCAGPQLVPPGFDGPLLQLDHGVDIEHFAAGGPRPGDLPAGPVLLFAGKIDERVDQGLLCDLPGTAVLLGRATVPIDERLIHLPEVPYAELPAWLAAADVLLLPYRRNAQTDSIQPLKLREFLAAGPPIAATGVPEIARLGGDLIDVGEGPEEFAAAVRAALARPASQEAARRGLAEAHRWQRKATELLDFVASLQPRRSRNETDSR
jgi:glycosyltransferase involved in cell wall biosynthesis